jgi:diadenylate cyclase
MPPISSADILIYLRNALDIFIVYYLIYRSLLVIKGTRAAPMLGGLSVIVVLYFLSKPLGLVTLGWLLGNFLSSIILVVVVIFQDEIRRGLTKVGLQPIFHKTDKTVYDKTIEDITLVVTKLSKSKIGALIVLQRDIGLDEIVEEAVILDALLNRKLLISLFVKESPLHDGAVLIDGDRIRAAGCVLPLSFNPDLDPNLGTRHRAALGLSERSDAIVIAVSEENGAVSLAREGRMVRNLDASMLRDSLHRLLSITPSATVETEEE